MSLTLKRPRWLRDLIWSLKHRFHPKHQYHIVRTGLPPGYYDQDVRMMHAMFALLVDLVEEEGGADKIAAFADEIHAKPTMWRAYPGLPDDMSQWTVDQWQQHYAARDDMQPFVDERREQVALYRWWTAERKPEWDAYYALFDGDWSQTFEQRHALLKHLEDKDDEMLRRLLAIRRTLWT